MATRSTGSPAAAVTTVQTIASTQPAGQTATQNAATTAATTTAPPSTVADPSDVAAIIPPVLWKNCELQNVPDPSAIQTAVCVPPAQPDGLYHPTRWQVSTYPDSAALQAALTALANEDSTRPPNSGDCSATQWGAGAAQWKHGDGKAGGHRFCYADGDDLVMVWTHEKLGQSNHVDVLSIGRAPSGDHPRFYTWWNYWHHQIGRLQTG